MVHFIGAGPGDPELLTIKGKKLIDQADVIIYAGSLVNKEVLAGAKEGAEIYNSGLIQPNYHIQTDKLSQPLEAGTYDCTATFTAYDTSDSENPIEVGSAAAKITISVLS